MKQNTTPLFFCFTSKCPMWQTVKQNRITFAIVLMLFLYFVVMDILLYRHIQQMQPIFRHNLTQDNMTGRDSYPNNDLNHEYSPFEGLGVKMLMMDQPNDYVHIPMATIFNKVTHFSEIFFFVTPNMISVASILVALVAAKFVTSDILLHRQFGVLIFEFRHFLDALDGAVYRSQRHQFKFITDTNSFGGVVDGVADVCGFSALIFGCYIYLKKSSSRKRHSQDGGLLENGDVLNNGAPKHSALKAMASFGFQIIYGAISWNMYLNRFHNILETPMPTVERAIFQNAIMKSNYSFIFMWIWRLANAHGLIEILALFIFIDKLWEFIIYIEHRGIVFLTVLILCTHLYYMDVKYMLNITMG